MFASNVGSDFPLPPSSSVDSLDPQFVVHPGYCCGGGGGGQFVVHPGGSGLGFGFTNLILSITDPFVAASIAASAKTAASAAGPSAAPR